MDLEEVARGPRLRGHDRHLAAGQRVEKRGFPCVGQSQKDDFGAVPKSFAATAVIDMGRDFPAQPGDFAPCVFRDRAGHIVLVREVELGLEERPRLDQPLPPSLVEAAQRAVGLAHGLPPLRLGLRLNQVGDSFDLGQIEPAVEESPPGELAGLRRPEALQPLQFPEDRGNHRAATVDMELGDVLAGETSWRRKEQGKPAVKDRPVVRLKDPQAGLPGFRQRADQRFEGTPDARAAQSDQRHGGWRGAARKRKDRIHAASAKNSCP